MHAGFVVIGAGPVGSTIVYGPADRGRAVIAVDDDDSTFGPRGQISDSSADDVLYSLIRAVDP